jgi:hypothetical protein
LRLKDTWKNMLRRCENPAASGFKNYGGRNIKVCFEWHEFEPFYNWAIKNGYNDDLTIDRINNDGNYEPENCQWLSRSENSRKEYFDYWKKTGINPPNKKNIIFKMTPALKMSVGLPLG